MTCTYVYVVSTERLEAGYSEESHEMLKGNEDDDTNAEEMEYKANKRTAKIVYYCTVVVHVHV